jgi:uncharacterized protein (TIGR02996 family)
MHYTDRPEWAEFLKRIIEQPEDDTVRLVLCDWLEENGQAERAEFIRVQCEIERRCAGVKLPPLSEEMGLKLEEIEPYRVVESRLWEGGVCEQMRESLGHLAPAPVFVGFERNLLYREVASTSFIVRRGFVAEVRCTLADWCGAYRGQLVGYGAFETSGIGPDVVAAHPVERVILTGAVRRSAIRGSLLGALTRESAGPLYDIAFPDTHGRIEGNADQLDGIMSEVAIRWAELRNKPVAEMTNEEIFAASSTSASLPDTTWD